MTRISCILLRSEICRLLLTSQYLLWRGWQSEPALVLQLYPAWLSLLVYKIRERVKKVDLLSKLRRFTRISSPEESCNSLTSAISCWHVTRLSGHQVRLMNKRQNVHHFHIIIKSTFLFSKGLRCLYNINSAWWIWNFSSRVRLCISLVRKKISLEEKIQFNMHPYVILYVRCISISVLSAVTPWYISQCSRDIKSKMTKAHKQKS